MVTLSVIYPKRSGTFFDHDYYLHKHIPMVKTVLTPLGLRDVQLLRGAKGLSSEEVPYELIALLQFGSEAEMEEGLGQFGKQIIDDIANFTDMKAAMQMNRNAD